MICFFESLAQFVGLKSLAWLVFGEPSMVGWFEDPIMVGWFLESLAWLVGFWRAWLVGFWRA